MSVRSRARYGLLALLLVTPVALAQGGIPTVTPPTVPGGTGVTPPSGTHLDIREPLLNFYGNAESPERVIVYGPDSRTVLVYETDLDGRARLDVAGANVLTDATFLRLEGDPLGVFTLVLRAPTGLEHAVVIDRGQLLANAKLPIDEQLPAVTIERPIEWPGAPLKSYLHYVEDAGKNRLIPAELHGNAYLQRGGAHRAVLQIPHAENQWDRFFIQAKKAGASESTNVSFASRHSTDGASIHTATLSLANLAIGDGETAELRVYYEKRPVPTLVERYPDPLTHKFRVDGGKPSITLEAPAEADDFTFEVRWSGQDALSGVGIYTAEYRKSGETSWVGWTETAQRAATFSGDWGTTYDFRVRSVDRVGNPSDWATKSTRVIGQPAGNDDVNDPPNARLLTPRAGSVLAGIVSVTWQASDPDGTPVTSKLELSDDEGLTWRTLYAGPGTTYTWDTMREHDGPGYRLRLTVSDGTLSAADALSALTVENVVVPDPPTQPPGSPPATPTSAPADPGADPVQPNDVDPTTQAEPEGAKKGVPAPFAGLAILVAAALAARRARRE